MCCTTSYPALSCRDQKAVWKCCTAFLCQNQGWRMAVSSSLMREVPLLLPCPAAAACMVPACKAARRTRAALAGTEHGQADSPAWEISKEAAFCKPHFHLTSLNIFQFQNTLKNNLQKYLYGHRKELSSFGDSAYSPRQSPQLPSCSVTLCLFLSLLFWECLSLFFLKLSCFTPPCLMDSEGFASVRSRTDIAG